MSNQIQEDQEERGEPETRFKRNTRIAAMAGLTRSCPIGYTDSDVAPLGNRFQVWMVGQTLAWCNGREYDHETGVYRESPCANHPHGKVFLPWDVQQYLSEGEPLD